MVDGILLRPPLKINVLDGTSRIHKTILRYGGYQFC